jgi:hypothetical protein
MIGYIVDQFDFLFTNHLLIKLQMAEIKLFQSKETDLIY